MVIILSLEVEESGSVPDWFLDYDKQKAIKDETFRLKVCSSWYTLSYNMCFLC